MQLAGRKTIISIIIPKIQSSGLSFQPAYLLMNSHLSTKLKQSFVTLLPPFNARLLLLLLNALFKKCSGTNQGHSICLLACPLILVAHRLQLKPQLHSILLPGLQLFNECFETKAPRSPVIFSWRIHCFSTIIFTSNCSFFHHLHSI